MRVNARILDRGCSLKALLSVPAVLVLLLSVSVFAQHYPAHMRGEGSLKVMTYNMYVGTEWAGVTDPSLAVVLQAVTNSVAETRASDPPGRMQAIARQIAATRPHLVSLQEVAMWSTGPTKDNQTLEFDYLQLLLNSLAAQGVRYTPAASLKTWEATLPSSTGLYVRGLWRVVILARADLKHEEFSITNVQASTWSPLATLSFPLPAFNGSSDCPVALVGSACVMPFQRGWISADVSYRGKHLRYISAHLESLSNSRNIRQGLELLNGPANTALPVVIGADLNCDLSNPADPKYVTCVNFLNAGFVDAWTAANPSEPGFTKNLPAMTMRSDYIMVRGNFGVQAADLVGDEPADMTPSGLWPSNHCGVVARLRLSNHD